MSPTPLELGSKLALDKLFPAATEAQIRGTPQPEQLERLPARMSKVRIPARMLQPVAGAPTAEPTAEPITAPQMGRISRVRLPQELQLGVAPPEAPPEEVPPIEPAEEEFPEEGIPFTITSPEGEEIELTLREDRTVWMGETQVGRYDENDQFIPTEPSFWQKTAQGALTAVNIAFAPMRMTGMALYESLVGQPYTEQQRILRDVWSQQVETLLERYKRGEITREEYDGSALALKERYEALGAHPKVVEREKKIKADWEDIPWYEQLLWETPAWAAMVAVTPSATALRAGLAPIAAKPGVVGALAGVARAGLAPVAGFEWLVGKTLSFLFGKPAGWVGRKIGAARMRSAYTKSTVYKSMPAAYRGSKVDAELYRAFKFYKQGNVATAQRIYDQLIQAPGLRPEAGFVPFTRAITPYRPELAARAAIPAVKPPVTPPITPALTQTQWGAMTIPDKVSLVKSAGLSEAVGFKAWSALTKIEKTALSAIKPVTPEVTREFKGLTLKYEPNESGLKLYEKYGGDNIIAYDKSGKEVGRIFFGQATPESDLGISIQVNPELRRQGIATAMTRMAQDITGRGIAAQGANVEGRAFLESLRRKEYIPTPPTPEVAKPPVRPPVVDKLNQIIKALKPARAITEKLKHAELAKRVAGFSKALEAGTGRGAFLSAMKSLRGKLPVAEFALPEEIALSPAEVTELHELIKVSKFQPLTKLRISNSLDALLTEGKLPTEGEIPLLQEIFGEEFVKSFIDLRTGWAKGVDLLAEVLNLPRAFLTPIDWSFLYRQGAIPMLGEPEAFTAGAFKASVKGMFSEKMATDMMATIKSNKYWPRLLEAKVAIMPLPSEPSLPSWRPEPWVSHLAEKIPIIGEFIKRSELSYVSAANKIRSDMFYRYCAGSEGMEYPVSWDRSMADMINTATGRGSLGALNRAMPILNMGLFSVRLQAARITFPLKMFTWAPPVRRLAMYQAVRAVLTVTTIISALKAIFPDDVEIETDPRSTDSVFYGKIKIGNTRIDLGAGFGQYLRLIMQLVGAERKLSTGEIIEADRSQLMERFIRSKFSPVASFVVDLMKGQTFIGEEMSLETEDVQKQVYNRFTPLFIQDLLDALNRDGITGGFTATPGWIGVGIVTYPPYGLSKWEESVKDKMGEEFLETNRDQLQSDYAIAEDSWYEYYQLPTGKSRAAYRFDNPEIEASLFFWGEVAQITNPASWEYVNDLVSQYQLPPEVLPIRAPEEPWEPTGRIEEDFGDLMDMLPKYISDYVWENQDEWKAKDLATLIPAIEKLKLDDRTLIDRYNRITAGEDTRFKTAYRKDHPDIDVALNFWGNVSAVKTSEARDLLRVLADKYGIPYEIFPALVAGVRKPTKIKLEEWP